MARPKGYVVEWNEQDNEWKVRKSGNTRASRVFDRKKKAVSYGKKQARRTDTAVRVFTRDGRHQETQTYTTTDRTVAWEESV